MTVIEIREPGGPDVLIPATRPMPVPGAGEILIKIAAAGINRPDVMQRTGNYPPPPGASDIPGLEVAGTVAAIGDGVTGWSVGDPVCALLSGGGYATYCLAPAPQCLPIPKGILQDTDIILQLIDGERCQIFRLPVHFPRQIVFVFHRAL